MVRLSLLALSHADLSVEPCTMMRWSSGSNAHDVCGFDGRALEAGTKERGVPRGNTLEIRIGAEGGS